MKIISLALVAGVVAAPAFSCDLCSIYSATQARGEIGKGFYFGAAEQFTHFSRLQLDGRRVPNESGQYVGSSISQLFAGYNFNDRLGLQFALPVIDRSFKRPEGFATDRGSESGFGDASLVGNFLLYRALQEKFSLSWSMLGGIKFPTGSSDRIREEFNEVEIPGAPESGIHGHDLTLGTGSFDGVIGTGVFARYDRLFMSANVQYAIRTQGSFGYRFANDVTWSAAPGIYVALDHHYTVAIQAVLSGEHKGTDTFRGESAEDTGVTAVYLGPQVSFTWSSKLSAQIAADLPVKIDNTALQAVPGYRLRASVNWHF